MSDPSPPRTRAKDLVYDVARKHDLGILDILRPDLGLSHIQIARQEAYYVVSRAFPNWSQTQLGNVFNRDPSTISHGIEKHVERHGLPRPNKELRKARRWVTMRRCPGCGRMEDRR